MDHTFLPVFELESTILDFDHPIESILHAIKQSITESQLRDVLRFGIKYCYENALTATINKDISIETQQPNSHTNSNSIITAINATFVENFGRSFSNQTDRMTTVNNVLNIQTIMCQIFQFLNFQSLVKASQVNKRCLRNSYHPSSIYTLNINNNYIKRLLKLTDKDPFAPATIFRQFARFSYAKILKCCIIITKEDEKASIIKYLLHYLSHCRKLCAIEINLIDIVKDWYGSFSAAFIIQSSLTNMIEFVLKNNCSTLTHLNIYSQGLRMENYDYVSKTMQTTIDDTIIKRLDLTQINFQSLHQAIFNGEIYSITKTSTVQRLDLINLHFTKHTWFSINQFNLSNVRVFNFHCYMLREELNSIQLAMDCKLIEQVAQKLVSLEKCKMVYYESNSFCQGTTVFISNLPTTSKSRINNLDITITSQDFNDETSRSWENLCFRNLKAVKIDLVHGTDSNEFQHMFVMETITRLIGQKNSNIDDFEPDGSNDRINPQLSIKNFDMDTNIDAYCSKLESIELLNLHFNLFQVFCNAINCVNFSCLNTLKLGNIVCDSLSNFVTLLTLLDSLWKHVYTNTYKKCNFEFGINMKQFKNVEKQIDFESLIVLLEKWYRMGIKLKLAMKFFSQSKSTHHLRLNRLLMALVTWKEDDYVIRTVIQKDDVGRQAHRGEQSKVFFCHRDTCDDNNSYQCSFCIDWRK